MRNKINANLPLEESEDTVGAYFTTYMEEVAKHTVKPTTYRSYLWAKDHITAVIGHIKLKDLASRHLESLYAVKLSEGLSKRSVQYIHSLIRKMMNKAVKTNLVARNPAFGVEAPKPERKEPITLSIDQSQRLFDSVESPRWRTIYVIAVLMGLRKSEILGLRWEDVNFRNRTISIKNIIYEIDGHIYQGTPKTKKSRRTVLMPDMVCETLNEYRELAERKRGLIFTTSSGRPVSPRNLSRHFYGALEKADLPRIRFHDLRHTSATILLSQNVHPKVVQEMLGHSTITLTLDTYSHVIQGIQKEAANTMDKLFK
jgi:integrase